MTNQSEFPAVSCMCPTYGRVSLLEEAVESFLRQDYPSEIELLIVNDLPKQRLIFDHPQVRVFNRDKRFTTMGEKRSFAVENSKHDWIIAWDDDDIHLPWRITRAMTEALKVGKEAVIERTHYWCKFYEDYIEKKHSSLSGAILFSRRAYEEVGGYDSVNSGQDAKLNNKFMGSGQFHKIQDEENPSYIYRWATHTYHLSGYGPDRAGSTKSGYKTIEKNVESKLGNVEPEGDIKLKPHWKWDYLARCQACSLSA